MPMIWKKSLHEKSNENGTRAIYFANNNNNNNNNIKSPYFPHKNIWTWQYPDERTNYQIDYELVDGRQAASIMDVQSCRGAGCELDHHLV